LIICVLSSGPALKTHPATGNVRWGSSHWTHLLDVIRLAEKIRRDLFWAFPAEARNSAVVPVGIEAARDAGGGLGGGVQAEVSGE